MDFSHKLSRIGSGSGIRFGLGGNQPGDGVAADDDGIGFIDGDDVPIVKRNGVSNWNFNVSMLLL